MIKYRVYMKKKASKKLSSESLGKDLLFKNIELNTFVLPIRHISL